MNFLSRIKLNIRNFIQNDIQNKESIQKLDNCNIQPKSLKFTIYIILKEFYFLYHMTTQLET